MVCNGVESFAQTKTNDWSETNQNLYDLKRSGKFCWNKGKRLVWDKPKYCASHLMLSQYFSDAHGYQNSAWSPKWIDIHRKTLALWFETEWKVLLKQRQTIGLRQTEKSCLALNPEPRFLSCITWSIKILQESQHGLTFLDKHYLYGLKRSGKFCWNKDKRLVWDKLKNRASRFTLSQLHG